MNEKTYIPWVEKYRPNKFENIVLDVNNRIILNNILKFNYFPHLLFYGPPGIGKTTTIINIIEKYQENNNNLNKGLTIHLNASDERGIDVIRYQINNFANCNGFFNDGLKFIILDEVDYMTKNAQQALKYLIQETNENIRFCLICNYISKVEDCLQNEFIKLRFNALPKDEIYNFLIKINENEKLLYSCEKINNIIDYFKNDLRSMINYMQSNQSNDFSIANDSIYIKLLELINNNNYNDYCKYIYLLNEKYKIDIKNIIKNFLNYVIIRSGYKFNEKFINNTEYLLHNSENNFTININYLYFSIFKSESEEK